jgi:hypothetical protein
MTYCRETRDKKNAVRVRDKGLQGPHVSHHLDGPDLTFLQKLKVSPIRRHFSEKFAVMKMNAIDQFMSPRNFRSMSCLVIEKKLNYFSKPYFLFQRCCRCAIEMAI